MILLLGATGYVGPAFAKALRRRRMRFIPLSRSVLDYGRFDLLLDYVRTVKPAFIIHANECTYQASERLDGLERMEMLQRNTLVPQTIASVCSVTNTPWGHVSSGSIYVGAKVYDNGRWRVEPDLSVPGVRRSFDSHPERFRGFSEHDEPNFTFRAPECTFFSGTQALGEEAIRNGGQTYLWRLQLPFNEEDDISNFLSQVQTTERLYDSIYSLSQLDDCVGACLELWERRAPFGVYHVVNPGGVTTCEIVQMMQVVMGTPRGFKLMLYEGDDCAGNASVPHHGGILDSSKLITQGIRLPGIRGCIEKSLRKWQPQDSRARTTSR